MTPTPEREALAERIDRTISEALAGSDAAEVLPSQWSDGYTTGLKTMATVIRAALSSAPVPQVLPALPKRENRPALNAIPYEVFTADQMRAYARAALQGAAP